MEEEEAALPGPSEPPPSSAEEEVKADVSEGRLRVASYVEADAERLGACVKELQTYAASARNALQSDDLRRGTQGAFLGRVRNVLTTLSEQVEDSIHALSSAATAHSEAQLVRWLAKQAGIFEAEHAQLREEYEERMRV